MFTVVLLYIIIINHVQYNSPLAFIHALRVTYQRNLVQSIHYVEIKVKIRSFLYRTYLSFQASSCTFYHSNYSFQYELMRAELESETTDDGKILAVTNALQFEEKILLDSMWPIWECFKQDSTYRYMIYEKSNEYDVKDRLK